MIITHEVINETLCKLISYPNGDVFSLDGYEMLADWSEQQGWWHEFVKLNGLSHNWVVENSQPEGGDLNDG